MEMALAKYPVILYVIVNRLSEVEVLIGMLGALLLIFGPMILMDGGFYQHMEDGDTDWPKALAAIGAFMILLSLIFPSTNTALNMIAHNLIDPSEYGGNFEQYQWDLEILKNFISHNY